LDLTNKINWNNIFNYFIFSFIGTIFTIYVVVIGWNAVIASSIAGIIFSIFTITVHDETRRSWAGFAGSFAGMTSTYLLADQSVNPFSIKFILIALFLSAIVGVLYSVGEIASSIQPGLFFDGYGGRLGTIAFISVIFFLLFKFFFKSHSFTIFDFYSYNLLNDPLFYLTIPSAMVGAMISMEIKNAVSSLNDNYKVLSVAITGMIGGILITKIPVYGEEYALAWYTGAFVGMSSYFILMLKRNYFFSGIIAGVFYVVFRGVFTGVGGKLGFISFMAVLTMRLIGICYNVIISLINKNKISSFSSVNSMSGITVDDKYAQKLVESIMRAKEAGEDVLSDYRQPIGDFVIGERFDYQSNQNEKNNEIINFKYMNQQIKEIIEFITNLGVSKWVYLQKSNKDLIPFSYKNISDESIAKCVFSMESSFSKILTRENRIISFSSQGVKQPVFSERFIESDLSNITYLLILPILETNEIQSIFILMYKNYDANEIKRNMKIINQFYKETILRE